MQPQGIGEEENKMIEVAQGLFGIKVAKSKRLGGLGGDTNMLIDTEDEKRYVLKVSKESVSIDVMNEQEELLKYMSENCNGILFPISSPDLNGQLIPKAKAGDNSFYFRLMKFIAGSPINSLEKYSKQYLRHIGNITGRMTQQLRKYPKEVSSDYMIPINLESLDMVIKNKQKKCLDEYRKGFVQRVMPVLAKTPKVPIHGDFHNDNMMIDKESQKIVGIIDFGAMGMSHSLFDLGAIICHLLCEPVKKCQYEDLTEVVIGFLEETTLSDEELSLIYYFIGARAIFLFAIFPAHCQPLIDFIMEKNGPEYTEKIYMEAIKKWRE